jgi:predicted GNAT family acetyltransferase
MSNLVKKIIKESIREYLNENEEISIRFGRSAKRNGYTVQNVIVNYNGKDITGQLPKTNKGDEDLGNYGKLGLDNGGELYLILPDSNDVAYVGTVNIPKELRGQGIGTKIYQAIADKINKPIRNSTEYKFADGTSTGQSNDGQNMWKNRDSFQPRTNTQF